MRLCTKEKLTVRYSGECSFAFNSGVILSQMISGITDEFSLYESADTALISKAFSRGVEKAYCSVSSPVEGTMLTVLREASV